MDAAQGERLVEEVVEQFRDPAERAVADEQQAEHELPQPALGDGQSKEDRVLVGGRWGKGLVQRVVGLVELLVDELATDLMFLGQGADRVAGQDFQGELLALLRQQGVRRGGGRTRLGSGRRGG